MQPQNIFLLEVSVEDMCSWTNASSFPCGKINVGMKTNFKSRASTRQILQLLFLKIELESKEFWNSYLEMFICGSGKHCLALRIFPAQFVVAAVAT